MAGSRNAQGLGHAGPERQILSGRVLCAGQGRRRRLGPRHQGNRHVQANHRSGRHQEAVTAASAASLRGLCGVVARPLFLIHVWRCEPYATVIRIASRLLPLLDNGVRHFFRIIAVICQASPDVNFIHVAGHRFGALGKERQRLRRTKSMSLGPESPNPWRPAANICQRPTASLASSPGVLAIHSSRSAQNTGRAAGSLLVYPIAIANYGLVLLIIVTPVDSRFMPLET